MSQDDPARQRDGGELVEAEQVGAQAVVDIVGVVGDIVGESGDLRLGAGEAPELQILHAVIAEDRLGNAVLAIAAERRARRDR